MNTITSSPSQPSEALWEEIIPGGGHWSWHLSRGTTLCITALDARANCAVLLYARHDHLERYSSPDTCKAQHTTQLTQGQVMMSDLGRAMVSITEDQVGGHDALGGLLDTPRMERKYGQARFGTHGNKMHRSGRDGLLIEVGKYGLGSRDLIAPLNLFSLVKVDANGNLHFQDVREVQGMRVQLRCEMDLILAITTAPHPLDSRADYAPGRIAVSAWVSGPAPKDDQCGTISPEAARSLKNSSLLASS